MAAYGLDFGTTNSALSRSDGGETRLASFPSPDGPTSVFRSVLFFDPDERDALGQARGYTGPAALHAYEERNGEGRLIQSIKSHLSSRSLQGTSLYGRQVTIEDLVARILRDIKDQAEADLGPIGGPVVVGRPVRYVGIDSELDDPYPVERMRIALAQAGLHDVSFEYEPVAAAFHHERALDHDEVILVGDFGGGTTDFCLMTVGPSYRGRSLKRERVLGADGVGIAGDVFDGKVIRRLVAPVLGRGTTYRSAFGKDLAVPDWWFVHLETWHRLSLLGSPRNLRAMADVLRTSSAPERLEGLIHIVRDNLGFSLARSVEDAKIALSSSEQGALRFSDGPVSFEQTVQRADFDRWIRPDIDRIEGCLDGLLERVGVTGADVDVVFLTGGTGQVPSVRQLFVQRFGEHKLRGGDHLTSVASGLALVAEERARQA